MSNLDIRTVRASELQADPRNYRGHPEHQEDAVRLALAEVGNVIPLLARENADGQLILIDGHLRAQIYGDQEVPVIVLNVSEHQAGVLLASYNELTGRARVEESALQDLVRSLQGISDETMELLSTVLSTVLPDIGPVDLSQLDDKDEDRNVGDDEDDGDKVTLDIYLPKAEYDAIVAAAEAKADEHSFNGLDSYFLIWLLESAIEAEGSLPG